MTPFAFIIHPIDPKRDAARKYWFARYLPVSWVEWGLKRISARVLSEIEGVRSITGAETRGWFIGCGLTPKQMLELPTEFVYGKILECCELAASKGARLIGLGAFTAVVGDGGVTISKRSPIPVTTGNSYTVATAIEGTLRAAEEMGIETRQATLAVVGATGSIGHTCATILAPMFANTLLIGRDPERTRALANELGAAARPTTDIVELKNADVIISVTSSDSEIIEPEHLKPGCVVCDVARPRDVSVRVQTERDDVLVIEGGVVEVPGDVKFGFDFGFPPKTAYACMSETMILALENRAESFTVGKNVSVAQVEEMQKLAAKHGFRLAGFRSFEKPVTKEKIRLVKSAAAKFSAPAVV
jgi:predicted amino acid dehydrogenase